MVYPVDGYGTPLDSQEFRGNNGTLISDSEVNDQVVEVLKNLPERYKRIHQGKVRDTYEHPDIPDQLIIIATDRVSTHDVVHKNTVPGKGEILTQISNFWFQYFSEHSDTKHIKTQKVKDFEFPRDFPDYLKKRAIIVQKLTPLPTEAIVRGYHYGSAIKGYDLETGKLSTGIFVGTGLEKCSPYEEAIFTPSTKGKIDININFEGMITHIDTWLQENNISGDAQKIAETVRAYSLVLYKTANEYARSRGITIGDTKFEFALNNKGEIVLIDEACTPDSSRFWTISSLIVGREPDSYDKQPLREEAIRLWEEMGDTQKKTPLNFSQEAVDETVKRYQAMREVFDLTDLALEFYLDDKTYYSRMRREEKIFVQRTQGGEFKVKIGSPEWKLLRPRIKEVIFEDGGRLMILFDNK